MSTSGSLRPVHDVGEQEPGWDDDVVHAPWCECEDCDAERDRIEATEDPNSAPAWPLEDEDEDEDQEPLSFEAREWSAAIHEGTR